MLEVLVIIIRPGVENRRSALPRPEDERATISSASFALRRQGQHLLTERPRRKPLTPCTAPHRHRDPGRSHKVVEDRVRHISDRLIRFAMSSAGNDTGSGGWCPGNVCHLDGWQ